MTTGNEPEHTDVSQLEEIQAAWQAFDDTGDITVLADYLAEEVVHSPMEAPPIEGKDAVVDHLRDLDPTNYGWEITRDDRLIGEDLAVLRFTIRGTTPPENGSDSEEVSLSSVDVFKRQDDGSWKQVISQPNRNG